jgi:uncharacterized protein with von Willebrand factor type A (vWA) domain
VIQYPHIKGAGVVLPDCSQGIYTPFRLTNREKRELVRKLAETGFKGIDEFLESDRKEGAAADKLEQLREQMQEHLEKIRTLRRKALDDQIRRMVDQGEISSRMTSDSLLDESGFRRYASEEIRGEILASELIGALEGRVSLEDRVEKVGFLMSLWNAVKRFFIRILSWIIGLFYRLRKRIGQRKGRSRKMEEDGKERGAISLPFPSLERDLSKWERKMDERLDTDKNLQKAVDQRLSDNYGYTSGTIRLRRTSDPEWYRNEARKVLREEVERKAKKRDDELRKEKERSMEKKRLFDRSEKERREEIMRMEKAFEKDMSEVKKGLEDGSRETVKKQLISALANMGYLKRVAFREEMEETAGEWEITEALVEKFSELIYAEVMQKRKGMKDQRGRQVSDAGVYEKARLRTVSEESRMDILQTIVNTRINHPGDRTIDPHDITVLREVTTSEMHAVIIMDVSGSMEENFRMEAAKRSVLALTQAVKRDNPKNRVDLISLSTRAKPMSLRDVMTVEPRGFTNHQEALGLARTIFDRSRADKKLLFLITDGLPEAYISPSGEAVAGDLEKAMDMAISEASGLLRYPDLVFNIFLLEPEDDAFVSSARRIAKEGGGDVIVADPKQLASRVLGTYEDGTAILGGV